MNRSAPFSIILFLLTCFLAGCTSGNQKRGYDAAHVSLENLKKGVTTKEDILKTMGSPSSTGSFDDNTWYYITREETPHLLSTPEIEATNILKIQFSPNDIVSTVEYITDVESPEIEFSDRKSEVRGYETGFMREIFSNLGHMNSKSPTNTRTDKPRS